MNNILVRPYEPSDSEGIRHLLADVFLTGENGISQRSTPMRLPSYCSYVLGGIGLFLFSRPGRWVSTGGALLCTAGAGLLAVRLGIAHSTRRHHHEVSTMLNDVPLPSKNSAPFLVASRYTTARAEDGNFMPVEEFIGFCTIHHGTDSVTIKHLVVAHKFNFSVPSLLVQRILHHCANWKVRTMILFTNTLQQDEHMSCRVELECHGWEPSFSKMTWSPTFHRLQIFQKKSSTDFDLISAFVHDSDPTKYKISHQIHVLKLGQPMSKPSLIPQTECLLRSVLRSIQDPVTGTMVGLAFKNTFHNICFALSREHTTFPGNFEVPCTIADFTRDIDLETWVTTHLDTPFSGEVKWGLTNREQDQADKYGYLVPALNGELVLQYEHSFTDSDIKTRIQAELGFLIIITYLHELCHAWLRRCLKNNLPKNWKTPPLCQGQDGESGRVLEGYLLGGDLRASWNHGDARHPERFLKISGLWLGPVNAQPESNFQKLDTTRLNTLHQMALGPQPFDLLAAFTEVVKVDEKSPPKTSPYLKLVMEGELLRASPVPAGSIFANPIPVGLLGPDGLFIGSCALERERKTQELHINSTHPY